MRYSVIGVIGAMKEEINLLLAQMTEIEATKYAGLTYYNGIFEGRSIVLTQSGVGKVNGAVCTQVLIDRYNVGAVIFTGVAGAVDPTLEIGDIVISTSCIQHDMDVTALGYPLGVIPYADNSEVVSDSELVRFAANAGEKLYPGRCRQGLVLSGDQFIADKAAVQRLYSSFGGACVEMEGAAVASVCSMNNVPHVIIRSMSDKADGSAHVNFNTFVVEAADRSFAIVKEMVQQL